MFLVLLVKFLGNADESNSNLSLLLSIISGQVLHLKDIIVLKNVIHIFFPSLKSQQSIQYIVGKNGIT